MIRRCVLSAMVVSGLMLAGGCGNGDETDHATTRRTDAATRTRSAPDEQRVRITQTGARGDVQSAIGNPDEFFMVIAAQLNAAEVAAGRLALDRSENTDVRDYAQRMIDDHTAANQELTRLAERKGISPPKTPDETHRLLNRHLEQLDRQQFDREYISAMVADHAMALSMMQDRARLTQDADLRDFAERQVPVLRDHLRAAQDLNLAFGAGAESMSRAR